MTPNTPEELRLYWLALTAIAVAAAALCEWRRRRQAGPRCEQPLNDHAVFFSYSGIGESASETCGAPAVARIGERSFCAVCAQRKSVQP